MSVLKTPELARALGVSERTVDRHVKRDRLPVSLGRSGPRGGRPPYVFDLDRVREWSSRCPWFGYRIAK